MFSFWMPVLVGAFAVYSWKIFGYLLPRNFAENKEVVLFAGKLTVALLASLTVVQAVSNGQQIVFDSRIPALGFAAVLYWRKVPFIVVVFAAAAIAAAIRYFWHWG